MVWLSVACTLVQRSNQPKIFQENKMYAPYNDRSNRIDSRPFISNQACDRLARMLQKIPGLRAAYLYPVFDGLQYVFVGIVDDEADCNLFNLTSQYSPRRHPMSAQSFTAEQLRVYELQSLVSGLSEWQKSLDLPKQSPPFLHDAFLLPHDWRYRYAEFQKLYHAEESRCFQKLAEREPIDIFK